MQYRTEIVVPPDRYVCLQLPTYIPEGRAVVTVFVADPEPAGDDAPRDVDPDRHDIEWWDEFDRNSDPESESF